MPCKLVTCPESGQLEMIVYEDTSFGIVVDACTRFGRCPMECSRACAVRCDREGPDELSIGDTTTFDLELPAEPRVRSDR